MWRSLIFWMTILLSTQGNCLRIAALFSCTVVKSHYDTTMMRPIWLCYRVLHRAPTSRPIRRSLLYSDIQLTQAAPHCFCSNNHHIPNPYFHKLCLSYLLANADNLEHNSAHLSISEAKLPCNLSSLESDVMKYSTCWQLGAFYHVNFTPHSEASSRNWIG